MKELHSPDITNEGTVDYSRSEPGCVVLPVVCLTHEPGGPGFNTRTGHILLFLLPLIQEGQFFSVTCESMCTKYWLNA